MDRRPGVLDAAALKALIAEGGIVADPGPRQVQPASLDLTLGPKARRVRAAFLPSPRASLAERLDALTLHELDLREGAVLEKGCVYVVELRERLRLPRHLSATANPKSSTGRIDVFVRLLTDTHEGYERVPAGYEGKLYLEICPRTFPIIVREGSSLNQLRVRDGSSFLSDEEIASVLGGEPHVADGLNVSVDLSSDLGGVAGWRARRHAGLIDVDKVGALDPREYFEAIAPPPEGYLTLDPDEFYILASREEVCVPNDLAAEMVAMDEELGAFRAHYAGFFDPGFGVEAASRAVLEVRGFDVPMILEHGQRIARLRYERLGAEPEAVYGSAQSSNYQGQGLRLSKHFRQP
ncbi:2'-deoxycytidine 5'-triphosphate deaminase [Parvularcula sp. ZS-1/3]|uniref:2'-deoxycytidine 5'-triphosphate deaminase n=1 Tax=Parvularcula mediterranea TaxID=2732508 RepID=A0A7Y3W592_9PROT|nr:2'-deoxycytidine 5'-triphosphate deaminase [Parvularcula mediterranea]NNU16011.1 2'-deoxycytidine 5'-triphosphate deaminase [Parvularcula mediterranea]